MVAKIRAQRIAERIREELSEMLLTVVTDPGLAGVTITDVTVDRELAYANVYVSSPEGSEYKEEIILGFERAKGFLRYHLSQRIELRIFPKLRFKWDPTFERAERIDRLIASLPKLKSESESEDESTNG
jgi:ribosome-binding factor A